MAVPLTASRLWRQMTAVQRAAAARAFWSDEEAAQDQAHAALLIAQQKKFRPKTVVALDLDRKVKHLASLAAIPDALAARVLIIYHLSSQREMMCRFLDALGIAHENGLIQEDTVMPEPAKLAPATAAIARDFPPEDVRLYLCTLLCQDPQTWGGLADLVDSPQPA